MPSVCWQCGQPVQVLFCPACGALQQPPQDYFKLFGLEEALPLDPETLQQAFYALSRKLHPDRFTRKPQQERDNSLAAAAILNDAYRTLRDPVKRAEYVLSRHGFDIGEQRSANVPAELLEEVFEMNEALEEIRNGDESLRPQLEEARAKFSAMLHEIDDNLESQFQNADLQQIRATLNRRRYIQNLLRDSTETAPQPAL